MQNRLEPFRPDIAHTNMLVAIKSGPLPSTGIVQMDNFQLVKPDISVEARQSLSNAFLGMKIHACSVGVTVVRDNEGSSERSILSCQIVNHSLVFFDRHFSHRNVEMPRVPNDSTWRGGGKFVVKSQFLRFMASHVHCIPSYSS